MPASRCSGVPGERSAPVTNQIHGDACRSGNVSARVCGPPRLCVRGIDPARPDGSVTTRSLEAGDAAIEGAAVAGGMELALWCDLRVMAEDAFFGVYCRRWGIPLIDGGTVRLPRLVRSGRAMDIILTGRKVPADEALRIGLCERVVSRGSARAAAEALAREIARFPQAAVQADRRRAYESFGLAPARRWRASGRAASTRSCRRARPERHALRKGANAKEISRTSESAV